jgi:RNA polymerase sigma-70 factor (ECF subfamily)
MHARHDRRPDGELLRQARSDPDAFRVLYDRHARAVCGWLAARTGSEQLALDLTAETFAEAFRVARRFRAGPADARPWLLGIAANLLRRSRRARRVETRARERLGALEATRAALDDPADRLVELLDLARMAPELARALETLPQSQRTAIELRVGSESSYAEIAATLGCSAGAARVLVFRGLRRINRVLGDARALPR